MFNFIAIPMILLLNFFDDTGSQCIEVHVEPEDRSPSYDVCISPDSIVFGGLRDPETEGWAWCSEYFDCGSTGVSNITKCKTRCCDTPAHWSIYANCEIVSYCMDGNGGPTACPPPTPKTT